MSSLASRRAGASIVALTLLLGPIGPAAAYPRPGRTTLASGAPEGGTPAGISTGGTLSADGRYIAFTSSARALDPSKGNGATEVYVRDLLEGDIERATLAHDGGDPNQSSFNGGISADGRFVVFTSAASNLVEGDTNGKTDTFVRDLVDGTTRRVSVTSSGAEANWASQNSAISRNGRFVTFASRATNLIPETTNGQLHIFVKDLENGTVYLASRSTDGTEGNGSSFYPDVSDNGRVTFYTFATNLIPDDRNARNDVYVHDIVSRTTERASVAWDGAQANDSSNRPVISADGRYVAFASYATNLVPNGTTPQIFPGEVYVRDLAESTTERVSTGSAGNVGDGSSQVPEISPDGRYVGFTSFASDLVKGDTNGMADAYLFDRELLRTERVSLGPQDVEGNERSSIASITPDARYVGFFGQATNFAPLDENGEPDVFARERGGAVDVVDVDAVSDDSGFTATGGAVFSGAVISTGEGSALAGGSPAITRADLIFHPEEGHLLFRSKVSGLQMLPTPRSPSPLQTFAFTFSAGGSGYEVRVYEDPSPQGPSGPYLVPRVSQTRAELFRCSDSCSLIGELEGSIGTTGSEVRAAVPLDALALDDETTAITGITASVGAGLGRAGATTPLHELSLPDGTLARPSLAVAAGPEDADLAGLAFTPVDLDAGRWSTNVAPGSPGMWLKPCLGDSCTYRWFELAGSSDDEEALFPTALVMSITAEGPTLVITAGLTNAHDGTGIAGRELSFTIDGVPAGTAETDVTGKAVLSVGRQDLRPGSYVTVSFIGDSLYAPSETSSRYSPGQL